jgi:hypothetical protein
MWKKRHTSLIGPKLLRLDCVATLTRGDENLTGGGETFHQELFAFQQGAEVGAGWIGFDAALDFAEFAFGAALLERFDAAFRFLPGHLAGILEQDFEQDAAVAIFERGANFGGLNGVAGQHGSYQGGQNFLGFKANVKLSFVDLMGEFEAEGLGFGEHSNDAPLDRLCRATDEFGLEFDLVAALFGSFVELSAEDGFVEA